MALQNRYRMLHAAELARVGSGEGEVMEGARGTRRGSSAYSHRSLCPPSGHGRRSLKTSRDMAFIVRRLSLNCTATTSPSEMSLGCEDIRASFAPSLELSFWNSCMLLDYRELDQRLQRKLGNHGQAAVAGLVRLLVVVAWSYITRLEQQTG
ncbi:uncharacterized protein LAESUDRAFT_304405 [Laetiporus sulphureus 93-53]|uniref:Uncharacterized protein n=1 Tax=Laetiporus sulphureus 93-53 TaxID=1314785 RepID=A0A165D887_9APHY|nr:uncharacterized protein LAESUDRAFT_304405 [Laetiporus sulphureus 93-53]KZT04313.1 hypothetical protein LAESUDRAFT_304405 [Laetiporus sulphureus 93-53]